MNRVSLRIGVIAAVAALGILFLAMTAGAAIGAQPIGKNGASGGLPALRQPLHGDRSQMITRLGVRRNPDLVLDGLHPVWPAGKVGGNGGAHDEAENGDPDGGAYAWLPSGS